MIKKGKIILLQHFPMDLFSADINVYMQCDKSTLFGMQFCFVSFVMLRLVFAMVNNIVAYVKC